MIPDKHTHAQELIQILLFSLFYVLIFSPIKATAIDRINQDTANNQKIELITGKSKVLESPASIKRITLAQPEIADVQVLSPRQIYLIGKNPGTTNATVWGAGEKMIAILDIKVFPDTTSLKEKIYEMAPNEKDIKVTASHDSLIISGTVSNTANLSQVIALAKSYAPKDKQEKANLINLLEVGGVHQVMLEVRVAEMSRTLLRRLGVNFSYIPNGSNTFGISLLKNLVTLPDKGWPGNPLAVSNNVSAAFQFLTANATWTGFVDALKENGLTKVLAEPTLITTSGRPANFLAGGEFPIPVPQGGLSNTITIDYKTFGVGLAFTPTVLSNDKISLEVKPEVSELDFTTAVAISGYVVPGITTRRVSTVIELGDGQSFAIAGLLRDELRETISKYPVLGDIPVLGALFRSTSFQKSETELVIIVTPHLVKPVDMAKQTLPTDQYIEPNDFEFYLLGSLEGGNEPISRTSKNLNSGKSDKSGFEGEFGHIAPK